MPSNTNTIYLPAENQLTIVADEFTTGYYSQQGNPGDTTSYPTTSISAGSTINVGPFDLPRYYKLVSTTGQLTYSYTPATNPGDFAWNDEVNADIIPDADSTRTIGSSAKRFSNIYADAANIGGNIAVSGTVDGRDLSADGTKLDSLDITTPAEGEALVYNGTNFVNNTNLLIDTTDVYGRQQIHFKVDNNVLRLGAGSANGDALDAGSEGIVVYNDPISGTPQAAGHLGYARIKSDRFGLWSYDTGSFENYWFRVDPTSLYLRNDSDVKTFEVSRATGNITVSGTVDGRDIATDGTKLDGIEAGADVTDEANVTASLSGATLTAATLASTDKVLIQDTDDLDNLKTVTAQDIADLASISQGELTDVNLTTPTSGDPLVYDGTNWVNVTTAQIDPTTGNITTNGTVDGRDIAADGTKLDGIEANADVTDEANVTSALSGATLTAATVAGTDKVLVQDADDLDNLKTVTAQSIADLAAGTSWSDAVDADIIPDADGTRDLGSLTNRFAEAHIDSLDIAGTTTVTSILDEDAMTSNSATALATQQSIKAYVDAQVAGGGGGDLTLVSSGSASDVASIDFTGLSAGHYRIVLDNINEGTVATTILAIRTSSDGGSTFDSGSADYNLSGYGRNNSGTERSVSDGGSGIAQIQCTLDEIGNTAGDTGALIIDVIKPSNASAQTKIFFNYCFDLSSGFEWVTGAGRRASAADVDAVRVFATGGNISANYALYQLAVS